MKTRIREVKPVGEEVQIREYPKGIKWTRQRKDVYEVLYLAQEPLTAVQIYNRIVQKGADGGYAVSTIYRILSAFEEKGLVSRTSWLGDGTAVYELDRGEHTHYAVCLECRRRVQLDSCPFAHLHLETGAGDFMVTGHKLELYGYCKECNEAGKAGDKGSAGDKECAGGLESADGKEWGKKTEGDS